MIFPKGEYKSLNNEQKKLVRKYIIQLSEGKIETSDLPSPPANDLVDDEKIDYVFCDGSSNQKSKASFGIFFKDGDSRNEGKVLNIPKPTNNKAELYAIYYSLDKTDPNKPLIIYSDSDYSIKCLTKFHKKWEKNGWKKANGHDVLNQDLIKSILKLLNNRVVNFIHVRAHNVAPTNKNSHEYFLWYGNNRADYLAVNAYP